MRPSKVPIWIYWAATVIAIVAIAAPCLSLTFANGTIIDDAESEPAELSFVASIEVSSNIRGRRMARTCSGSVVEERHILTDARCVASRINEPEQVQVKLGCLESSQCEPEAYDVARVMVHPGYDGWSNNIALIRTRSSMKFTRPNGPGPVRAIELESNVTFREQLTALTMVGWGAFRNGMLRDDLGRVVVREIPLDRCRRRFPLINEDYLCTNNPGEELDFIASGGPIFKTLSDGTRLQVGIVSGSGWSREGRSAHESGPLLQVDLSLRRRLRLRDARRLPTIERRRPRDGIALLDPKIPASMNPTQSSNPRERPDASALRGGRSAEQYTPACMDAQLRKSFFRLLDYDT